MSQVAVAAQKEIELALGTIPNGPGKFVKVFTGATDDNDMRVILAGQGMEPTIILNFTGFSQTAKRQKHITGARHNSQEMHTIVNIIASSDDVCRQVWGYVNDILIGFMPTNCGEMDSALYNASGQISFLGSPTRYSVVQAYTGLVNSDKVC